jgi:hypothetical protein
MSVNSVDSSRDAWIESTLAAAEQYEIENNGLANRPDSGTVTISEGAPEVDGVDLSDSQRQALQDAGVTVGSGGAGGPSGASGGGPRTPVQLSPAEAAAFQQSGLTVTPAGGGTYYIDTPTESVRIVEQAPPPPPEPPSGGVPMPSLAGNTTTAPPEQPPVQPEPTPIETQPQAAEETAKGERKRIDPNMERVGQMDDRKGKVADPKAKAQTDIVWNVKADGRNGTATVEIGTQTTYRDPKDKSGTSAYGRGTTEADKKAGNTSLGFHEQQHRLELERYMTENPPPQPNFREGMSTAENNREVASYKQEKVAYDAKAESATAPKVDEGGYPQ